VIPWETLGRARAEGGGELVLYRRGGEYVIRVNGRELMSSRAHGSEAALAELACARLTGGSGSESAAPRVLVGGLGMGYTLRATLDLLPATASVVVAEIVPEVVEWNRGPLAALAGDPLRDPRVTVEVGDVGALLRRTTTRFDAILLDVDNGPIALTRKANQSLYADPGLVLAKRCLRPAGVMAVWSAAPDDRFVRRLTRAGFAVETHDVPARGVAGGPKHTIFVGRL
jgi:spermidine synthase